MKGSGLAQQFTVNRFLGVAALGTLAFGLLYYFEIPQKLMIWIDSKRAPGA